jgi:hypothetical protein
MAGIHTIEGYTYYYKGTRIHCRDSFYYYYYYQCIIILSTVIRQDIRYYYMHLI